MDKNKTKSQNPEAATKNHKEILEIVEGVNKTTKMHPQK